MPLPITVLQLEDALIDVNNVSAIVNGSATDPDVPLRLGGTAITLRKAAATLAKGDTGAAATVAVGSVTTGDAGSEASVTNVGTSTAAVLNIKIPQGIAATVAVGTQTTGTPGSSVVITDSGTAGDAILDFTIPRGDVGESAYAVAIASGFVGTETQWLATLVGPPLEFLAAYNPATTYAQSALVSSGNAAYASNVSDNVGNTPATSPTQWFPILTIPPDPTFTSITLTTGYALTAIAQTGSLGAVWGVVDEATGNVALYLDATGKMFALNAQFAGDVAIGGGLSVSGSFTLAEAVSASSVITPAGELGISVMQPATGLLDAVAEVTVDAEGRVGSATDNLGSLLTPAIGPDFSIILGSDSRTFYVKRDGNQLFQIFTAKAGLETQLTFAGNNWAPVLASDELYLSFRTDRMQKYELWRMTIMGGDQMPVSYDPDYHLVNDYTGLLVNGQSLAAAFASGNPVTTTPYGNSLTITGGPNNQTPFADDGGSAPVPVTGLVPCVETILPGSDGSCESPCSAMVNQFSYLCQLYRGFTPTPVTLTSASGGESIAALSRGTPLWQKTLQMIQACSGYSTAANKTLLPRAVGFVHGEADSEGFSTTYEPDLVAFVKDYATDLPWVTGVQCAPLFFITQLCNESALPRGGAPDNAALAQQQLNAVLHNPGSIYLAGTTYQIYRWYANLVSVPHMYSLGYQWIGMVLGSAMFRALCLKQKTTGLYPLSAIKIGTTIYIRMHVPVPLAGGVPSLTIDTTSMAPATGRSYLPDSVDGFEVYNSAGTAIGISSVTIIGDENGNQTIVKLVCATDPGTGGKVGYAANGTEAPPAGTPLDGTNQVGEWGNLRDNDTTPALYPTGFGSGVPLWNWCARFYMDYTT